MSLRSQSVTVPEAFVFSVKKEKGKEVEKPSPKPVGVKKLLLVSVSAPSSKPAIMATIVAVNPVVKKTLVS